MKLKYYRSKMNKSTGKASMENRTFLLLNSKKTRLAGITDKKNKCMPEFKSRNKE